MNQKVKHGSSWKEPIKTFVKDAGVWKESQKIFVKNAGVWKEVFSNNPIVTDGLVLHLDADNSSSYPGSGTTWHDLSGLNNDVVMDSTFTPTFNSGDSSFYFTGGDNFETKDANIDLSSKITMISWYKKTGSGAGSPRVLELIQSGSSSGANSHCLAIDTDGSYRAWVDVGGTTATRLASADDATAYSGDTWYMYAYTFDGTTGRIYHNAVETAVATDSSSNLDTINTITIGAIPDVGYVHSDHHFTGNIAITQVYNKALSLSDIQQNFEATRNRFGI